MTPTPDKTRSVGETDVSARPVSDEQLSYISVRDAQWDIEYEQEFGALKVSPREEVVWPREWAIEDRRALLSHVDYLSAEVEDMRSALGRIDTALGEHLLVTEDGELAAAVRNTQRSIVALVARIASLEARNASLEKDAGRLDYLIEWLAFNEDVSEMPVRDWDDKDDARAAIDAAMKQVKEGG